MAQVKKFNAAIITAFIEALKEKGVLVPVEQETENTVDFAEIAKEIKAEIGNAPARSCWAKGVRNFAVDLFTNAADWIFSAGYYGKPEDIFNITEKTLLNGADNWKHFSHGGCWLVYNGDIAKALRTPSELKRTENGYLSPNKQEDWLDVQARALYQASKLILETVKKYREAYERR